MIAKTRGIALSFVKYGDTSIISKIYTEKFGIQTYIVNGVRSKKSKTKISLFQPLTLLEMVAYHKENSGIQRITELKCFYPYISIPHQQQKIVISFFIQEFLSKLLRSEQANEGLFEFLSDSFKVFDMLEQHFQNFHLQFILKISDHLGFSIGSTAEMLGHIGKVHASKEELENVDRLINESYDTYLPLNVLQRREILKDVLKYYSLNYEGINDLQSLEVIKDILD